MEGDIFVDTGRLHQKQRFEIEDVRGKGREDGTLFPDRLDVPEAADG